MGTYFLTKVVVAGTTASKVLRKSTLEREVELASAKAESVKVLSASAAIK